MEHMDRRAELSLSLPNKMVLFERGKYQTDRHKPEHPLRVILDIPTLKDKYRMPYRVLCNSVKREGVKASPGLASWLFCYVPLHKFRYGIFCCILIVYYAY